LHSYASERERRVACAADATNSSGYPPRIAV